MISSYLDIGGAVPVSLYRHPEGKIRLRMNDIDDDEPVPPALAVIEGGEPWLLEDRDVPWAEPEPITEPISIVPDPPSNIWEMLKRMRLLLLSMYQAQACCQASHQASSSRPRLLK